MKYEMGSLSSKNLDVKYLLRVSDVFIKHVWVKHLTNKKAKTVPYGFYWDSK